MIFCPPRYGKSELATKRFPAHCLGCDPNEQIIACSHTEDLAISFNREIQQIMLSETYAGIFPGTRLNPRGNLGAQREQTEATRNAHMFKVIGNRGHYLARGVGGAITGYGGTILIMDDPIKNAEEALSETYRERLKRWYTSTFLTRAETGARKLVIMTRWHEDDLAGWLLEKTRHGGEKWDVVDLPAMLDTVPAEGDPRQLGEALWPEKHDVQALAQVRIDVGPDDWEALYQQRPSPKSGGVFQRDWFVRYTPEELPKWLDDVFTSWDMTFQKTKSGSFVVGQVWGRAGINFYLLDQVRVRCTFTEALAHVKATAERWDDSTAHVIEGKANGPAIIDAIKDEVPGVISWPPKGQKMSSKEARARSVAPKVAAGNVHVPRHASFGDDLISECAGFPRGAHDDQVDAMVQALQYGGNRGGRMLDALTTM